MAAGAAFGLVAGAFAIGVGLGDGSGPVRGAASRLTLDQLAGQRIVAGFTGARVPLPLRRLIHRGRVAGVILFSENLPSRAEGRRLIRGLNAIRRPDGLRGPLLVMVDQEGGVVKRIGGAPTVSARAMGSGGTALSRREGRRTARNLRDIGINVNLAPVLDVARPGGTITETDRGFGSTPGRVAATAVPFAASMQAAGVAAAAKHFPGLGAARLNTDLAVQRISLSRHELRRIDEAPYRRFISMGGDLVMLSTAIYPAFSPKPAAFARPVAVGELRARLGFAGVSVTDALGAASVRAFGGPVKAGIAAARAGADLLLFTGYRAAARAHLALLHRLRAGLIRRGPFEVSVERVLDLSNR